MKTFLLQGDSITDANRVDENIDNFGLGCGYAFLLASDIEKNRKGQLKFINRGKSGDRITDVYARIKEDIINLKPDYMSILIGVNDVSHELTQGCGVTPEKFSKIYKDISMLQPEDTLQLVLEAETEGEKEFYELVGDFLLQKKQKQVIERNLF